MSSRSDNSPSLIERFRSRFGSKTTEQRYNLTLEKLSTWNGTGQLETRVVSLSCISTLTLQGKLFNEHLNATLNPFRRTHKEDGVTFEALTDFVKFMCPNRTSNIDTLVQNVQNGIQAELSKTSGFGNSDGYDPDAKVRDRKNLQDWARESVQPSQSAAGATETLPAYGA